MRHSGSVFHDQVSVGDRCKAAMNSRQAAEATADGVDPLAEALIFVANASTGRFMAPFNCRS